MTRVVAAIDASAATRPVLDVGTALAKRLGSTLEVVHVDEGNVGAARAMARARGLDTTVLTGDRLEALTEAFDQPGISLVIVGLRGNPGGRQPAGGTAMHVIETVSRPMVLVPPSAEPTRLAEAEGGTVLMPLNGAESMSQTVRELMALLRQARLEIRLLHVFDSAHVPRFLDQPQHALPAWTHEFVARHADADVTIETRAGHPDTAVLECAKEIGADMVALACQHREHERGRSLVLEVLGHTNVPVVLCPPRRARHAP